jgi:hypothetical protein
VYNNNNDDDDDNNNNNNNNNLKTRAKLRYVIMHTFVQDSLDRQFKNPPTHQIHSKTEKETRSHADYTQLLHIPGNES